MNKLEKIREATRHSKEAVKLLKRSKEIFRAQKDGLIEEAVARDAIIKLNNQALAEAAEANQLRRELTEDQDFLK